MSQRISALIKIALLLCLLSGFIQAKAQQPVWSATGALSTARSRHTATPLVDGRVLLVGGTNGADPLGSAELYDPAVGQWSATGNLLTPRYDHTAVRLASGKVLVVGGSGQPIIPTIAEIYDPLTGTWSAAGNPGVFLALPQAILLTDNRVLVTGGLNPSGNSSAVIYDSAANAWKSGGTMNELRLFHSTTLLPDGRVLVAGGLGEQPLRNAEIYDPATNRWTLTGQLTVPHVDHKAALLLNGKVLVAGGLATPSTLASAELYDPATSQWSATGAPITFRYWHTLTLLPNGKALAAGGLSAISAELYDPATGSWIVTSPLRVERQRHTATLLLNGKVLVAGGESLSAPSVSGIALASAELFDSGTPAVVSLSAASFAAGPAAPESIVAGFGTNLAASTQVANGLPLPTQLAGVSVRVRDRMGIERAAPLFFVSPNQINYQIPPGTANGTTTITVSNGAAGIVEITNVSPGLFSADASGVGLAAAVILRIKASGEPVYEPVGQFDPVSNKVIPTPIDVGNPAEQVYLVLFGTGFRHRSDLANVSAKIDGAQMQVLFAGAQGNLVGVDQCNVRLPGSLAGRGEAGITLTVDGKASNMVKVLVK